MAAHTVGPADRISAFLSFGVSFWRLTLWCQLLNKTNIDRSNQLKHRKVVQTKVHTWSQKDICLKPKFVKKKHQGPKTAFLYFDVSPVAVFVQKMINFLIFMRILRISEIDGNSSQSHFR